MEKHHLILGEITDFITGKTVTDTHDERERQSLAKFLVKVKGFSKSEIRTNVTLPVIVDGDSDTVNIDFLILLDNRAVTVVKYGPGSIVSRERPAIAAARLLKPYIIPFTVVSNGQDAVILDTNSGKVIGKGLNAIFTKKELESRIKGKKFDKLPQERVEKEERILFCMDVLSERDCECEETCTPPEDK